MKRYLKKAILQDLFKKIIIVTGPRQVGKTTMTKNLGSDFEYLNYDNTNDRKQINKSDLNFEKSNYIFDELHKMKNWKRWLKGHYDVRKSKKAIVVTGSAKIDTYKKVGDSLAGRFYQFQLFPLDVKEVVEQKLMSSEEALENLLNLSGFPEPFLSGKVSEYNRWRKTHLDIILKQDLLETEATTNIKSIEVLTELMTEKVGSLFSYSSLREDLQTDDKTIKRWCSLLEDMYVIFKIQPFSSNIKRSLLKTPKYFFYDIPRVASEGARFENLVALSLLKEICFRNDTLGENYSLHYLRNKNQNEVDFAICKNKKIVTMIECKLSDNNLSNHFSIFDNKDKSIQKVLLVKNLKRETILKDGTEVVHAHKWLATQNWE